MVLLENNPEYCDGEMGLNIVRVCIFFSVPDANRLAGLRKELNADVLNISGGWGMIPTDSASALAFIASRAILVIMLLLVHLI